MIISLYDDQAYFYTIHGTALSETGMLQLSCPNTDAGKHLYRVFVTGHKWSIEMIVIMPARMQHFSVYPGVTVRNESGISFSTVHLQSQTLSSWKDKQAFDDDRVGGGVM